MYSVLALILTWLVAIPIGIYSATHQYSWGDVALTFLGFLGLSVPAFMLGLVYTCSFGLLVQRLGRRAGVRRALRMRPGPAPKSLDLANHLLWPTMILGAGGHGPIDPDHARQPAGDPRPAVRHHRPRQGADRDTVVNKYAVRVAINPLISVMGMQLPDLIYGADPLGIVLSLPTIGPLFLRRPDEPGHLPGRHHSDACSAVLLMLGNLLADVALAWVDPRIRYE